MKNGDRVKYEKPGSEHDGMTGIYLGMREDGKCHVRFDDGTKFAANPQRLHLIDGEEEEQSYDPYGEESWSTQRKGSHTASSGSRQTSSNPDLDYLDQLRRMGTKENYTKKYNDFLKLR
jgi:hypothetical protein